MNSISKFCDVFVQAVGRGMRLHPGPYDFQEWLDALDGEMDEFAREVDEEHFDGNRAADELIDVAVVAYRFAKALQAEATGIEEAEATPDQCRQAASEAQ